MARSILIFRSQIIAGQAFPEKGRVKSLPEGPVPIKTSVGGGIRKKWALVTTWATLGWGQACVIGIIVGFGV